MTRAFTHFVAVHLRDTPELSTFSAFAEAHPGLLDKQLPLAFYSRERLMSPQARTGWLARPAAAAKLTFRLPLLPQRRELIGSARYSNVGSNRNAVDLDVEWPMPAGNKDQPARWRIEREIFAVSLVDDANMRGIVAVDGALQDIFEG